MNLYEKLFLLYERLASEIEFIQIMLLVSEMRKMIEREYTGAIQVAYDGSVLTSRQIESYHSVIREIARANTKRALIEFEEYLHHVFWNRKRLNVAEVMQVYSLTVGLEALFEYA